MVVEAWDSNPAPIRKKIKKPDCGPLFAGSYATGLRSIINPKKPL
jgi:hypothetical protein